MREELSMRRPLRQVDLTGGRSLSPAGAMTGAKRGGSQALPGRSIERHASKRSELASVEQHQETHRPAPLAEERERHDLIRIFLREQKKRDHVTIEPVATPANPPAPLPAAAQEQAAEAEVPRRPRFQLAEDPDVCGILECGECGPLMSRLRERYERIYQAVEQTGDSVVITDRNGVIEYVNPAFESTTGYAQDEVIGKTPRLLKSGAHDATFYRNLWEKLHSGDGFRGTIVNRKKNGDAYPAEQTITPIRDARGFVTHFVSVLKDITLLLRNNEQEYNMKLAREIQQRFYTTTATLDGFDLHGTAVPVAATGGDYFDFLPTPRGSMIAILADVSGHGFGAALVMSETRAYCRAFAAMDRACNDILGRVNERLYSDLDQRSFVTMSMLCLNPKSRIVTFTGAGHDPGVYVTADGDVKLLRSEGFPLGLFPDAKLGSGDLLRFRSGDLVVLMTDGITESVSPEGEEFGLARAIEVIRSSRGKGAKEISEEVLEAARAHTRGHAQSDDIAVVVCKAD